jgi:hypothetical protein
MPVYFASSLPGALLLKMMNVVFNKGTLSYIHWPIEDMAKTQKKYGHEQIRYHPEKVC